MLFIKVTFQAILRLPLCSPQHYIITIPTTRQIRPLLINRDVQNSVRLPLQRLNQIPRTHLPHSNRLVPRPRDHVVSRRSEGHTGHLMLMPLQSSQTRELLQWPDLDSHVLCWRSQQSSLGVKADLADFARVALEHFLALAGLVVP